MKTEQRYCALNALRLEKNDIAREDDDKFIHIKGYGCHFNAVNKNGEVVTEESFAKFFKELEEGGLMPVMNYQHVNDKIIGCWDKITADDTGLFCEGRIFKDVQLVKDTIMPLMDGGALDSLSTEGWCLGEWKTDDDGNDYFLCTEFVLAGISLVALPADFSARIEAENALQLQRQARNNAQPEELDEEAPKAKKSKIIFTI